LRNLIIIGAGVAGISAAKVAGAAGWHVRVLDKAARPGGRCATRRIDADPLSPWFDYGAQYFTARDSDFRATVEADLAAGTLQRWQPRLCVAKRETDRWKLRASDDDKERLIATRGLNHWLRSRLASTGAQVSCKAKVSTLDKTDSGWHVTLEDGDTKFSADAVLLTAPAVQSAALLGRLADGVPALTSADQAMSACHSLVVEAPAIAQCQAAFVKDGLLGWFADNSHKAGQDDTDRHLWTLHATPEFSDANTELATSTVRDSLMREFSEITGIDRNQIRPIHSHRWLYARPSRGTAETEGKCWVDRDQHLALAGDWLAGGRVEGAWLSGRRAAQALIKT